MPNKVVVHVNDEFDTNILNCAVPCCNSNTSLCPEKIFVEVPLQENVRSMWLNSAKIRFTTNNLYFCEDHFEKYGRKLVVNTPTKFECQYFIKESLLLFDPLFSRRKPFKDVKYNVIFYPFLPIPNLFVKAHVPITVCHPKVIITHGEINHKEKNSKEEINDCMQGMSYKQYSTLTKMVARPRNKRIKRPLSNTLKEQVKCYNNLYGNVIIINANELLFEHDYARVPSIQPLETFSGDSQTEQHSIENADSVDSFESVENTDSADSIPTFQCDYCNIEYIQESELSNHIHMVHQSDKNGCYEINESTDSAESIQTFKCVNCEKEFIQPKDLLVHIQLQHSGNVEDLLDIKSEIFQCNNCPSSFPSEETMLKHLRIMHGDYSNTSNMKKLASCKDYGSLNRHIPYNESSYESNTKSRCESNFSYFTEFETNVEIKREYDDPLEDIDNQNFYDHSPVFNQIDELNQVFTENQCGLNENADWVTDMSPNIQISLIESLKEFEPEEYGYSLNRNSDESLSLDLGYSLTIPEVVQCKTCQKTYATQEELLDHMHDLINTKAQLYAEAKKSLKADSVKFKNPFRNSHNGFTQYLSEAELLDYIHRVHDKSRRDKIHLQVVRYVDNEDHGMCKPLLPDTICRCCGKRLSKLIRKRNRDKICTTCRKKQINYEGRKFSTAKLYASAKNMLLQNQDRKSGKDIEVKHNPFETNNREPVIKQAMQHDDYIIANESQKWHEEADSPPTFGDNDLLTPLREENETVLVQSFDPSLCKSCRKPLDPSRPNNSVICMKCKKLDEENEKRRKIKGKRRASIEKRVPTNKIKVESNCYICNYKFHDKLELKEHVARSHV